MRIIIITTVLSTRVKAFEIKVSKEIIMLTVNFMKYMMTLLQLPFPIQFVIVTLPFRSYQ